MSAQILALAFCFAGVFCLTPLSVYLLWLAGVNRQPRPVAISGVWDFVALVAGLSGFLIFGSLIFVTAIQSNTRYWTRGNFEQLRTAWEQEKKVWLACAAGYLLIVLGAVILGLLRRKKTLSVYGADNNQLMSCIHDELSPMLNGQPQVGYSYGNLVHFEPFAGMSHAVVRITAPEEVKAEEIDRLLRNAIPNVTPSATSAAGWIHSAAVGCGVGAVCSLAMVFLYMWIIR